MPRAFTLTERNTAKAGHVWHLSRCEVLDVDDTWQDLSELGPDGINTYIGATVSTSVDANCWQATVRVRLSYGEESLSPLMEGSAFNRDVADAYAPLLNAGTRIRLYAKTMLPTDDPEDIDEKLIFSGRIDRATFSADPMVLSCRDLGGKLIDTIIRTQRTYGNADGSVTDAAVIQQLLTDNADLLGESITLVDASAAPFFITEQTAVNVSVMDAITLIASLSGKVVRYKFQADGSFALTLYDVVRDATTPDYTLEPDEYLAIDDAALDFTNGRNYVKVWYVDESGVATSVEDFDEDSIAAFGERFMQLGGDATASITTAEQAAALVDYALADLSRPLFDHTAKNTFTWFAELSDYVGFTGNNVTYDEDQALGLATITHEFPDGGQGAATTAFQCRGKPAGAYERWLRLQGGPRTSSIPPAPQIDFVVGESDSYGADIDDDASGYDGGIWVGGRLNAGCVEMVVYAELADGEGFSVDQTASTQAIARFRRPEGTEGTDPNFPFLIRMTTRGQFYKRIAVVGYSAVGRPSKENIWPAAVQAIDPVPTPDDGTIASVAVTADPTRTSYAVTVTPNSVDTTLTDNWLVITRNGVVLFRKLIGTDLSPVTFLDTGLTPQNAYQWDAFIWNTGVSGPKNRWVEENTPSATRPVFTDGTPKADLYGSVAKITIRGDGSGVAGADRMAVVKSFARASTATVGIAGPPLDVYLYTDDDTSAKFYKLIAFSSTDADVWEESDWVWWPGIGNEGSAGLVPPVFTYGTPKAITIGIPFGVVITVLAIDWTCATSAAKSVAIQESTDNGVGDAWSDVLVSASVAEDKKAFSGARVTLDTWYRLVARDATSADIIASAGAHYIPAT